MRGSVLGCAVLVACVARGPESLEAAQTGDVCGGPSPIRVLEVEDDELPAGGGVDRVGDRVLYAIETHAAGGERLEDPLATTIYSTDPCGGDRAVVAEDMALHRMIAFSPLGLQSERRPLGCRDEHDIYWLDEHGVAPPRLVMESIEDQSGPRGCRVVWTDIGLVGMRAEPDDELGALVVHPAPDDPDATVEVLAESVHRTPNWWAVGDEALVLDSSNQLIHIELSSREATVLIRDVLTFSVSHDIRHVLWQRTDIVVPQEPYPISPVFLRDRTTGEDTFVADASSRIGFLADDLIYLDTADSESLLICLSTMEPLVYEEHFVMKKLPDGRLVAMYTPGSRPRVDIIQPSTGELTTLFEGAYGPSIWAAYDEYLEVLADPDNGVGTLWRAPYDGSGPVVLADRASAGRHQLDDGRFTSVLDQDERSHGTFVLIDPDTHETYFIDEDVDVRSGYLSPFGAFPGNLAYGVSDGDRSGVWVVNVL